MLSNFILLIKANFKKFCKYSQYIILFCIILLFLRSYYIQISGDPKQQLACAKIGGVLWHDNFDSSRMFCFITGTTE